MVKPFYERERESYLDKKKREKESWRKREREKDRDRNRKVKGKLSLLWESEKVLLLNIDYKKNDIDNQKLSWK